MTTLRKPKATREQIAKRRADRHNNPSISHLMPATLVERQRMFDARMKAMQDNCKPQGKICNATMGNTSYVPGDGEVLQALRPGAMNAYTLPSRGMGT